VSEQDKPKTARSYRGAVVDDNAVISINIKWLIQALILVGVVTMGYFRIEVRIRDLEQGLASTTEELKDLLTVHEEEQIEAMAKLEEDLEWYQKELNINPFKKRKKK
jgi:hypothetical protein